VSWEHGACERQQPVDEDAEAGTDDDAHLLGLRAEVGCADAERGRRCPGA
jgi:hypothetical protein